MIIDDIAVVVSFDANYARYGFTVLQSVLNTAAQDKTFSFFVLHEGLNESAQDLGRQLFNTKRSNIFFVDVSSTFANLNLPTRWHFARQTYYRLRIPYIFNEFKYVIYLDSDVVVRHDISHMLTEMDDSRAIGAVRDVMRMAIRHMRHRSPDGCRGPNGENFGNIEELRYQQIALGLDRPDDYFQAGVIVFNVPRITDAHIQKSFDMIPQSLWMQDQDILNAVFKDSLWLLDERWNVLCGDEALNLSHNLPDKWKPLYQKTRENPHILHYGGSTKPWNAPESDFASEFTTVLDQVNRKIRKATSF